MGSIPQGVQQICVSNRKIPETTAEKVPPDDTAENLPGDQDKQDSYLT